MAVITIDRQERRNALDNEALENLIRTFDELRLREVSVVVLTGAGEKAFSAGSDLKAVASYSKLEAAYHSHLFQKCAQTIDEFPAATIAAIEGYCLGGGLEIALACDYRISSSSSIFGFPEILLNAIPSGGGTIRAPRAMGLARARELLMFGNKIDAHQAYDRHMVSTLVEPGTAASKAIEFGGDYAAKVDPYVVGLLKRALMAGADNGVGSGQIVALLADMAATQTDAFSSGIKDFKKQ
ncbi:enoyl-CoA hydratase/isomerase family protein [Mesorhizobium retamae]|uniref:Enoyl-CoA hydratase/isomerase family protein n=1 Tax=Mesorhizobium retamae TaxID=2912854 RepID=A0ABS9QD89_9HYPH|nr:enoyl-CoA hydratase/isomerase family protein [Mesorhizobium sp. IRAMC:0171]MCG7505381.1 enoyl-CoA hydratase/isomerase family protein [Mesorhizobium sp. IRAMC:0171]